MTACASVKTVSCKLPIKSLLCIPGAQEKRSARLIRVARLM